MVMSMQIVIKKDEWTPLIKKFGSRKVQTAIGNAGNDIAHKVKKSLVMTANSHNWESIADGIKVNRRGNINTVSVNGKGTYLDSMNPHYISLKRGRNITKWARNHMPLRKNPYAKGALKSQRIYKGPRGGIKGAIWVRPTPWIDIPLKKALRSNRRIVNRHIKTLLKTGG